MTSVQNITYEKSIDCLRLKPRRSGVDVLLYFLAGSALTYFAIWYFKPATIQIKDNSGEPTGEINHQKALIVSIIIGVILSFVRYAFD